jgi:hypothetical protein
MRIVDSIIARIEVRRDLNGPAGSSTEVRPVPSKRAPYSFEQALLMFDIAKGKSDGQWEHILRLIERPMNIKSYLELDKRLAVRRQTLVLQMRYIDRAKELQPGADIYHNVAVLCRLAPLTKMLALTAELQELYAWKRLIDDDSQH